MVKIYNIVAELCSYVIESCTSLFFTRFSCISDNEQQRIFDEINKYIPELFESDHSTHILTEDDLTQEFFNKLEDLIYDLKEHNDYFCIVGLVQYIDKALINILRAEILTFQEEEYSVVLNTNREKTGIGLLPRFPCYWERKRRLSHHYNRMDNFLFNLLLIENRVIGNLVDKHIFLKNDFFENFQKTKKLKIAATPLRNTKNFDVNLYSKDNIQYFSINYHAKNMKNDNNLIWQKIVQAGENDADIIVFPEMLGNADTNNYIITKLKALSHEKAKRIPSLIVLPSFWNLNRNKVTVLDKYGNLICTQCKHFPFRTEIDGKGYLEAIHSSMIVNVLHYEGIGRIAFLICKDFLTTRYMEQLMRCFKLSLIIVPSFSTGSYDFKQSFDLCAHDDCNVVWINTCAAMEEGKESNFDNIGYVRKRISKFDDESQKLCKMARCNTPLNKICNHSCLFFETIYSV